MSVRVVFLEPEHGGNIGSVARLMKNFELAELYLVNPKVDVGRETRAFAAHAQDIVENIVIVKTLKEALKGVNYVIGTTAIASRSTSNLIRSSISVRKFAESIVGVKGIVALLLGRESRGLSNTELIDCDVVVTIPSSVTYKTLNVASACSIIFYELWMSKSTQKGKPLKEENRGQRERLSSLFNQMCEILNLPDQKERLAEIAFKNVISRAFITTREVTLLLGIFRKFLQRSVVYDN